MKDYKVLIFDWDGTLSSSMAQIIATVDYAFDKMNLPKPSAREIRNIIGLQLERAMQILAPNESDDVHLELVRHYRDMYLGGQHKACLYDGVKENLQRLQENFELTIATGKGRLGLNKVLKDTEISQYFTVTKTVDECMSKPHPDMIYQILEETGFDAKDALMIGDTTFDLQMAKAAQVDSVAMLYGAHEDFMLEEESPIKLFNDFYELVDWLYS